MTEQLEMFGLRAPKVAGPKPVCANKRRYLSRTAAEGVIQFIAQRNRGKRTAKLIPAPCDHCNGWHLTKKRNAKPDSQTTL